MYFSVCGRLFRGMTIEQCILTKGVPKPTELFILLMTKSYGCMKIGFRSTNYFWFLKAVVNICVTLVRSCVVAVQTQ